MSVVNWYAIRGQLDHLTAPAGRRRRPETCDQAGRQARERGGRAARAPNRPAEEWEMEFWAAADREQAGWRASAHWEGRPFQRLDGVSIARSWVKRQGGGLSYREGEEWICKVPESLSYGSDRAT